MSKPLDKIQAKPLAMHSSDDFSFIADIIGEDVSLLSSELSKLEQPAATTAKAAIAVVVDATTLDAKTVAEAARTSTTAAAFATFIDIKTAADADTAATATGIDTKTAADNSSLKVDIEDIENSSKSPSEAVVIDRSFITDILTPPTLSLTLTAHLTAGLSQTAFKTNVNEPQTPGKYISQNMPSPKFIQKMITSFPNDELKEKAILCFFHTYNLMTSRSYLITKTPQICYIDSALHEIHNNVKIADKDHIGKSFAITGEIEEFCFLARRRLIELHFPNIQGVADRTIAEVQSKDAFAKLLGKTDHHKVNKLFKKFLRHPEQFLGLTVPKNELDKKEAECLFELMNYFSCILRHQQKINSGLKTEFQINPGKFKSSFLSRIELRNALISQAREHIPKTAKKPFNNAQPANTQLTAAGIPNQNSSFDKLKEEATEMETALQVFPKTSVYKLKEAWDVEDIKELLNFLKNNSVPGQTFASDAQLESVSFLVVAHALIVLNKNLKQLMLVSSIDTKIKLDEKNLLKFIGSFSSILHQIQYIAIYNKKEFTVKSALNFLTAQLDLMKNQYSTMNIKDYISFLRSTIYDFTTSSAENIKREKDAITLLPAKKAAVTWVMDHIFETLNLVKMTIYKDTRPQIEKLVAKTNPQILKYFGHFIKTIQMQVGIYAKDKSSSKVPLTWQPSLLTADKTLYWVLQSQRGTANPPTTVDVIEQQKKSPQTPRKQLKKLNNPTFKPRAVISA